MRHHDVLEVVVEEETRPRRSPAVYEKEDSSRLELRDYRPKITNLGELINFDPRAYFLRNVKLLRLSDRHVNKLARQEVRKETHQRRNKRSRKYLEFMNQYRAARPRRIRSMIERVGLQEFAAHHRGSKLTSKVVEFTIADSLPTRLQWRTLGSKYTNYNLHPKSPNDFKGSTFPSAAPFGA